VDTHEVDRTYTEAAMHRLHEIEAQQLLDVLTKGANAAAAAAGNDCASATKGRHDFRVVALPGMGNIGNTATLTCHVCGEVCTVGLDAATDSVSMP